jgi:hypothetical protein
VRGRDKQQANFIVMTNASHKPLKLAKGRMVEPLDAWTTTSATEEEKEERQVVRNLLELELDNRIEALPHLKRWTCPTLPRT